MEATQATRTRLAYLLIGACLRAATVPGQGPTYGKNTDDEQVEPRHITPFSHQFWGQAGGQSGLGARV